MSGDQKKIINPLLNASVTGATLEDYSQHAILPPAPVMEIPPVVQAPPAVIHKPPIIRSSHRENIPISQTILSDEPSSLGISQLAQNIHYDYLTGPPQPLDPQVEQQEEAVYGYKSVLSSFSSYLNLTPKNPEPSHTPSAPPEPTPSAFVNPAPYYPSAHREPAASVPLYSPLDVPVETPPKQPPKEPTNSYRRGGLKRPTYAPIPGLTPNSQLDQQTIKSHTTPLSPFSIRASPLQQALSSNFFEPELSGYAAAPALEPNVNPYQPRIKTPPLLHPKTIKPTFDAVAADLKQTSPFLDPLPLTEFDLPPRPPAIPYHSPTILSPSTYHSTPSINTNTAMATGTEDSRSSPTGMYTILEPERNIPIGTAGMYIYRPAYHHWFFMKNIEGKRVWYPFTMVDSLNLEKVFLSNDQTTDAIVATDGGRYDVDILRRERTSVYWDSCPNEVRRCSWFHKGHTDGRYVPYDENIATTLESEYKIAYESGTWNRKVELDTGETVVFHGPDVLVLFPQMQSPDTWGNTPNQPRPRVVKRGMDEFNIEEGEPHTVDHLLFLVHGIGSVCDLKFRSVEEVVDEFRSISLQLVQSHYKSSCEKGLANRVEVLPISWHEKLHSEDTGIDRKLKGITLQSIPRLRAFTNDTILDVLFYTSPVYCQTIISSVGNEINRIYDIFKLRNPSFTGGVSLGGHSLGSLILFDLLCHQHPDPEQTEKAESPVSPGEGDEDVVTPLKPHPAKRQMHRRISYMMGSIGTGQPQLTYPNLKFNPRHFFALGSPIGMFVTVRGLDTLGEQFALPTCPAFFNIFHPYDPVAYRIETLVNPELADLKPLLIPHHKGRKRMHLELKETMTRVGADLKQKLYDSMKSTWNSFYQFSLFKSQSPEQRAPTLEEEVDKVFEEQLQKEQDAREQHDESYAESEPPTDLSLGILNEGRRIDYVLQEGPLEFFNEYIFALTSHVCYWESEDTMLLILKEIYNSMNIATDSQVPQQSMTIERPPSAQQYDEACAAAPPALGVDPTMPQMARGDLGPPPMSGFVRKS